VTPLLQEIAGASLQHLQLVATTMAAAALLGIPAGLVLAHAPRARTLVLTLVNVLQTIPSLALFGFLIPLPGIGGIGPRTALIALTAYALLPIVRSTIAGVAQIDPLVRESAVAMGMTRTQILRLVELPLAMPVIFAGIRIATVTTVGTATIAAAIGAGGLGTFIFRGVATVDATQLLAGAVPAALMAIVADGALGWIERRLSPP
jgi:osmoprotectant transport system permease protein